MKGRPSSGWHPLAVVVICSGRRRRVLQYGAHHNVPQSPMGRFVAHPLQGVCSGAWPLSVFVMRGRSSMVAAPSSWSIRQ